MGVIVSDLCSPIFPICAFGLLSVLEFHRWPSGFDWNQTNSHNHTALYLASNFGHAAVVSYLLDRSADPDIKCGIFGTALQCAAYRGHDNVVEILVDRGANLKLSGKFESVLHAACSGGHEDVVMTLLDSRLEITTQSEYDIAATEVAKAGFARALEKLQAHSLSKTLTSDKIQQQARAAIINGNLTVLKRLISRSTFDLVVMKGSLALSAVYGHREIAELLIANGVDVDEHGHLGAPLRCASVCGHNNICRLLLDHGADIDANARFGTALHAAAMRGHLHTARFLLDQGANVNAHGGHYGTPMQAAAYHGHVELVNLFLDAKADITIPGLFRDALRAAIEGGRENVVRIFLNAGLQGLIASAIGYRAVWPCSVGSAVSLLPPRNILRDSSPSRHVRRPAVGTEQYDSLSDGSDSRKELDDGTNTELDPLDPAHAPRPHQMRRGPRRERPEHHQQDMFETAAALGHLAIVRALLSEGRGSSAILIALVAACGHGQPDVVRGLLESNATSLDCMRDALAAASFCHDDEIIQILWSALDKLEGQKIEQFLRGLLLSCVPENPVLFGYTLRRVIADESEHFVESTLVSCLCVVAKAGWSRDLRIILEQLPNLTTENIFIAFEEAFDAGQADTVSMLQKSLTEDTMTAQRYNGLARLAVQAGHTELFECLLLRTDFSGAKQFFENMIYCAAGSGRLGILTILTSQDWTCFYSKEALTKALLVAARNGHYDVSMYLVSKGAEVCQVVVEPRDRDILQRKASVYRYLDAPNESSSTIHQWRPHQRKVRRSLVTSRSSADDNARDTDPIPEQCCNSVEACLAGYGRFSVYNDDPASPWELANESVHAKTLFMLFDQCSDFKGPQWAHLVCRASAICPPDVLKLMIAKGADPCAINETTSALVCAAGRSTSTLAAVQALVSAVPDTAFGEAELRMALGASVSLFHEVDHDETLFFFDYRGTLFPMYDTIEEIFVSGPGAVVKYLLNRVPQERARGNGYSLCLQMAAAAGNYEVVRLLLERGVECNDVVGYYGTALTAACRRGHSVTAALLLDHAIAGYGASCTALQAAIMARSLSCVQALLEHGANTNLIASKKKWLRSGLPNTTPLSLAVDARLASISVLLIKAGACTKEECDVEQPLLIKACSWGESSVVRSLLESGADVRVFGTKDSASSDVPRQFGSALHAVIGFGHVHLIEILVAHGLDVTATCGSAGHPLEYAASKADIFVVARLLKLCPPASEKPFVEAAQSAMHHSRKDVVKLICEDARGSLSAHDVLLLCRTTTLTTECSIVWYLLERLKQLNGSAGQFAEACRHFMRHAQPAIALQLFTHAEKFLLSREIWDMLEHACLRSSHQLVVLLIETLQGRDDFDLGLETASTDVTGMLPEHVDTLLSYVPCTHAMFREACVRGDERVVHIGLSQGLGGDEDDGMQLPALHFAAAHGRTSIVKMLLKERPQSHGEHGEYGTPIEAALISCAAGALLSRRSLSEKDTRHLQDLTRLDMTDRRKLFMDDPQRDAACKDIISLLLVHNSHLRSSASASGSTLLALSLALYLRWHDVFRQLLVQGTHIQSCRRILPNPLLFVIQKYDDNGWEIVQEMLESDKSGRGASIYDPEGYALHQACRNGRLRVVEMLLARGYSFVPKNGDGQSALTVCLERLAQSLRFRRGGSKEIAIVETLLKQEPAASISDEDIAAACSIAVGIEQDAILQILLARWEPFHIPEEGIIRLLSAKLPRDAIPNQVMPWQMALDERRIEKATTNLFAGVDRVDVLTKLLDYDRTYIVGADTIDLVGMRTRDFCGPSVLSCINELLDRNPDLLPTESNVLRVLKAGPSYNASNTLDSLFARNSAPMVTEQMLKMCRDPVSLQFLLSREKTGEQGLVSSLMDALVEESKFLVSWKRPKLSARLEVLLDHAPRTNLSGKVIEFIMESSHLGNIERVLDRDPDVSITGSSISTIIKAAETVALHLDVVDFLRKHHDRYAMSAVRLAVESINMPSKTDELQARKLYYDLHGW